MTSEFKKEIEEIAEKISAKVSAKQFKEFSNGLLEEAGKKWANAKKEDALNQIRCQNDFAKQKYPESSYLSFNLATGNFIVPYDSKSKLTLEFIKDDDKKELELNTSEDTKLDVLELLKLCKNYEYCKIVCVTTNEFELFDEKEVESSEMIVKYPHEWSQTFEGFTKCSDVIAIYQNVAKIKKVEKPEA